MKIEGGVRGNAMLVRIAIFAATLALSACSVSPDASSPDPREAAAEGPPTVDGVYTYPDCEGEGGCSYRNWRTVQPTPLLAQHSRTANVIATVTPGEWVHVEEIQTRLIPQRGIVRENTSSLLAGETIYSLEDMGEGFTVVWHSGDLGEYTDEDLSKVDWAQIETPQVIEATLGTWARVTRENGQVGWVRLEYGHFECLGSLAGDSDCRD